MHAVGPRREISYRRDMRPQGGVGYEQVPDSAQIREVARSLELRTLSAVAAVPLRRAYRSLSLHRHAVAAQPQEPAYDGVPSR